MGKSSKQETKQTNEPPAWARPALEQAGKDALALYQSGSGYNTYTGPTMAPLSDVTLGGMNNLLAATGYTGAPVTNQSIMANVPDVNAIMQQALANKPKPQMTPQPLWQDKKEEPKIMKREPRSGAGDRGGW
ncbi:hypothetical protein QQF51_12705 [Brucella intermedia]|uniref:hypothetical protein n=1 Tax=Brucella intermedia TaxID=94625 RepID=UPI0025523DCE|nr:hypothetical protein [Brucella intermedia]MDL2203518.1 hypothetical protein [Brucella intermedia]